MHRELCKALGQLDCDNHSLNSKSTDCIGSTSVIVVETLPGQCASNELGIQAAHNSTCGKITCQSGMTWHTDIGHNALCPMSSNTILFTSMPTCCPTILSHVLHTTIICMIGTAKPTPQGKSHFDIRIVNLRVRVHDALVESFLPRY